MATTGCILNVTLSHSSVLLLPTSPNARYPHHLYVCFTAINYQFQSTNPNPSPNITLMDLINSSLLNSISKFYDNTPMSWDQGWIHNPHLWSYDLMALYKYVYYEWYYYYQVPKVADVTRQIFRSFQEAEYTHGSRLGKSNSHWTSVQRAVRNQYRYVQRQQQINWPMVKRVVIGHPSTPQA